MSFSLYHKTNGRFRRQAALALAGPSGLLAQYLQSRAEQDTPLSWTLLPEDLHRLSHSPTPAANAAVVLDMQPEALLQASLYEIICIRGWTETDTTDLVLACRCLYQGCCDRMAEDLKADFQAQTGCGEREWIEAVRLTGGTREGRYRWARPAMDIGAAVCPSRGRANTDAIAI